MNYKLENRYVFKGRIKMNTALHLGGGRPDTSFSDSPVVKTLDGTPFIPGSSFKGAFRSAVERIIPNFSEDKVNSCGFTQESDCKCLTVNKKLQNEYKEKDPEGEANIKYLKENLCDTCKLFGSPHTAARIFFSDLYVSEKDTWSDVTEVRDGVVIDRDSERAVDRLKFDYEVVPAGIEFDFTITVENADDKELAIVAIGIEEFLQGMIPLGGIKSRGLGQCMIKDLKVEAVDFTDLSKLKNYLLDKKMENLEIKDLSEKIKALF